MMMMEKNLTTRITRNTTKQHEEELSIRAVSWYFVVKSGSVSYIELTLVSHLTRK